MDPRNTLERPTFNINDVFVFYYNATHINEKEKTTNWTERLLLNQTVYVYDSIYINVVLKHHSMSFLVVSRVYMRLEMVR